MAKVINPQHFKWYRYLGQNPVVLPEAHEEYDVEVDTRELFGLRKDKKGFFMLHQDLLDEELPIDEDNAKLLADSGRAYTGKIDGKSVPKGVSFDEFDNKPKDHRDSKRSDTSIKGRAKSGKELEEHSVPILFKPIRGRPKPKQVNFQLTPTTEGYKNGGYVVKPLSPRLAELIDEAKSFIGLMTKIKADTIEIGEGNQGTMLLTTTNMKNWRKQIYIVIDPKQLARINGGKLDASILAQAITHELGHYIWNEGVVRNSDKMRWKKMLAGLRFHKDQYNHGQGYPWHEEHFAMMCEYAVHGRSARDLQTDVGKEIVTKYFFNEYFK